MRKEDQLMCVSSARCPRLNLLMWDGDSAVKVPEWTCGHHNDWLWIFFFFFIFRKAINRKGQSYSNEPTAHFCENIAGLVNSIHIFCVSFLTYHTSGKMQWFVKDIMCLFPPEVLFTVCNKIWCSFPRRWDLIICLDIMWKYQSVKWTT